MRSKQEQECRQAWREINNHAIVKRIENAGLQANLMPSNNRHIKITGGLRPVELYATTGTVNASPYGQKGASKAKGMLPERALERAISLAKHGH
jgi:hypothetical protein